jgi:hypothetical protein
MSNDTDYTGTPENRETRPIEDNPEQAQGRRIQGEGLAHEQDYIEERMTYAGNTDEYAEAAKRLEQDAADLERLNRQHGQ